MEGESGLSRKLSTNSLELEGFGLRLMEEKDLEKVLNWRNSKRIRSNMYHDRLIDWTEHQAWFEKVKKDDHTFFLVFEHVSQSLGVVSFPGIDAESGKCSWGFYIGEEKTPEGTGLRMGCLALTYAFEILNLRKLCGDVFAFNKPSIRYHLKLGFKN